MADTIVIQSIHPEVKKAVVVFNIEGKTYPKVLPFLTTQDADLLKQQLKDFATELRGEFDDLKAAVEAADANAVPQVSDAVNGLVGQEIALDTTPATPTDGGATPAGNTTTPSGDGSTPADTTATPDGGANGGANADAGNSGGGASDTANNGNSETPAA